MSFRTFAIGIILVVVIAMAALAYLATQVPRNAHHRTQDHAQMD